MAQALRAGLRNGGLRRGGFRPGLGNGSLFAIAPLDMFFARTRTLDPRVTFTRASSGTFVGSDGVLQRAVTNLLLRSEEFGTTWTRLDGLQLTENQIAAPNGTITADLLTGNGAQIGYLEQSTGVSTQFVNGVTYTFSIYLKKANTSTVLTLLYGATFNSGGGNAIATWNLDTGVPTFSNGCTGSMTAVGNGWYRCVVTDTATATETRSNQWLRMSSLSGDVYAWGAQLEQSTTVGEYIPTTSTINSAPRFDHNPTTGESLGLLVEEARTNSIRNNTGVGAVAGTPGTLPTNWVLQGGGVGTLTQEIVGTGTQNGINYIDIKYSGTTSTTDTRIAFEPSTQIVAATGQSWTASAYTAIVAGSLSNISAIEHAVIERNVGGGFLGESVQAINTTSALARGSVPRTLSGATAERVNSQIKISFSSGVAIDITLRIGLPQLEQGAFATSPILTSTAAATRSADVASITGTNFSSWYRQDEGTVFAETQLPAGSAVNTTSRSIIDATDGSTNNRVNVRAISSATTQDQLTIRSGAATVAQFGSNGTAVSSAARKIAVVYKLDDYASWATGATSAATDTSGALPIGINQLAVGSGFGGVEYLSGTIRRLTFWPQRLSNTTLQTLTQ